MRNYNFTTPFLNKYKKTKWRCCSVGSIFVVLFLRVRGRFCELCSPYQITKLLKLMPRKKYQILWILCITKYDKILWVDFYKCGYIYRWSKAQVWRIVTCKFRQHALLIERKIKLYAFVFKRWPTHKSIGIM